MSSAARSAATAGSPTTRAATAIAQRFHEEWIVTCAVAEMDRSTFLWGPIMLMPAAQPETPAAIRVDLGAIFVSLELSKSTWLVTSLAPGSEKISRHIVTGGDTVGLFA